MQTIPESYVQAGHPMKLIRREGDAAMYKAVGSDYWEVHRVRVRPAEKIMGKPYPERRAWQETKISEHGVGRASHKSGLTVDLPPFWS